MRLLMIEDDPLFGGAMQRSLMRAGYAVDWIQEGKTLVSSMRTVEYDGVLLDLGLPDVPGEQLMRSIREITPGLPIIVITARGSLGDRLCLLDIGADDYLVKPVDLEELTARVRAVTRRAQQAQGNDTVLSHGPLRLQPTRRTATWRGKVVPLTNREFWLLEALVRKRHEILSRERIEASLYGWGDDVGSNTVEVYIHHLRRKFDPALIRTVRGVGYQLGTVADEPAQP